MSLTVDPELRQLIAPLRADELAELEKSILRDGCLEPLTVWKHDGKSVLLDGHTRHKICTENGVKFEVNEVKLETKEDARLWIEEHQIARRNLVDDQRAILWDRIRKRRAKRSIEERAAKAREVKSLQANSSGVKSTPKETAKVSAMRKTETPKPEPKPTRVREQIAEASGLSVQTLRTAKKLAEKSPKLANDVLKGDITLKEAHREAFKKETAKKEAVKELSRRDKVLNQIKSTYDAVTDPEVRNAEIRMIFKDLQAYYLIPTEA